MIDKSGYRHGVGIILVNENRQVFWAKRIGMSAWQFPQGGLHEGETADEAMYRELYEEVGLKPEDVVILARSRRWLRYRLPARLIRHYSKPLCIGQKQKWYLLRLSSKEVQFDLQATDDPEFDSWAWVSYWYPLKQVIKFKKRVYLLALKEFAKFALSREFWLKQSKNDAQSEEGEQ